MAHKHGKTHSGSVGMVDVALNPPLGKVWGIYRCNPCNDTAHLDCLRGKCECPCRSRVPPGAKPAEPLPPQPKLPGCE